MPNVEPIRRIVVIQTPPTDLRFIQVTELMSEEEVQEVRRERPDLIVRYADELTPVTEKQIVSIRAKEDNKEVLTKEHFDSLPTTGLTYSGMTLPTDYHDSLFKIIRGEEKEPTKQTLKEMSDEKKP